MFSYFSDVICVSVLLTKGVQNYLSFISIATNTMYCSLLAFLFYSVQCLQVLIVVKKVMCST